MNASNIWDEILARVQLKVNRHSFYTWFKPTAFVSGDGRTLTVRVPNSLFKDWITKHYSGVISEALTEVRRPDTGVNFVASPLLDGDLPSPPPAETAPYTTPPSTTSGAGLNPHYLCGT